MSITMTAEQFTQKYLNGKSIKQLSQETGKGEWAIRKQIQRYQYWQQATQETRRVNQGQLTPITPKQKPANKLAAVLAAVGFMVAMFFIYLEIKERRTKQEGY